MGGAKERCYGLCSPIMFYQSAPSNISGKHFSAHFSHAAKVLPLLRPAHTRGHIAGTCCSNSFPRVTSPFLRKSSVAGTEFCLRNLLLEIQLAGLNSCVMKRGQNAASHALSPLRVPATCLLTCAGLYPILNRQTIDL